jgi:hypothetical protein
MATETPLDVNRLALGRKMELTVEEAANTIERLVRTLPNALPLYMDVLSAEREVQEANHKLSSAKRAWDSFLTDAGRAKPTPRSIFKS